MALLRVALPAGYFALLPGLCIVSISQGIVWTTMWTLAAQGAPTSQQAIASGIASTAQQIGGALVLAAQVALSNLGISGV